MSKLLYLALAVCLNGVAFAQFAPQAGISGSTAVAANSTSIVNWANSCQIKRGYMDIAQPDLGNTMAGDETLALGPADNFIVSLGDSGVATLSFPLPITNGPGADFVVFENGFINPDNAEEAYLELAFVEVSSDGVNFFRFPSISQTQTELQIAGAGEFMNTRTIHNLAGKYISGYGTPFDLEDLAGTPGLDITHVTHVRIVDVVGSLESKYHQYDAHMNVINDPYPTPFPTGGFDLDAVGVIHQNSITYSQELARHSYAIYPNPTYGNVSFKTTTNTSVQFSLYNTLGQKLWDGSLSSGEIIPTESLAPGVYYLKISDAQGLLWSEKLLRL